MNRSSLALAASLSLLVSAHSGAQTGRPQFKSGVDLIALEVCVKGRDGRPTKGLKPEDFLILENNIPQQIALFSADGHVPLAVTLLVDNSRSMAGARLERAKLAAADFIGILRENDLVEVMSFNDRANLRFPLGGDHLKAREALDRITASGQTGLFEAVLVSLRNLERAQRGRSGESLNVLIVLSDGEDTSSRLSFDDVIEDVKRSGVLIYTISLRTDSRDRIVAPLREMSQLAFATGGQAVAVRDPASLTRTYQEIGAELLHLYRVGYVPKHTAPDGRWRPISVRVPSRDLVIRTRSGYYAPRPPSKLLPQMSR